MFPHVLPDSLELYVTGGLDAAAAQALEAHVASCEACAEALAREARLELGLLEVASLPTPLSARRPVRVAAISGLVAAAAAVVLALLSVDGGGLTGPAPSVRRCDQTPAPGECLARGQFDGVISIGPGAQVVVPRYEQTEAP